VRFPIGASIFLHTCVVGFGCHARCSFDVIVGDLMRRFFVI
jgi:hypothetical protein